jgi:hypothetical protein
VHPQGDMQCEESACDSIIVMVIPRVSLYVWSPTHCYRYISCRLQCFSARRADLKGLAATGEVLRSSLPSSRAYLPLVGHAHITKTSHSHQVEAV